jgi:ATP adenylyltransferase
MEYVEAPRFPEDAHPFRDLPESENDEGNYLLHRGKRSYLILNRYPYNAGHLLAIPFREVSDLSELDNGERADLMDMIVLGKEILARAIRPDGFNIGFNLGKAAGAGLPGHLHCHIVPRWEGDTNFMPVLGDTRVLPASLHAMWKRLRACCPDGAREEN